MTSNSLPPLTYAAAGVDYGSLDAYKLMAQEAQRRTASFSNWLNGIKVEWLADSIGESAACLSVSGARDLLLAIVEEGLGTLNLAADECATQLATGSSYYDVVAFGTIASAVNDVLALGGLPVSLTQHLQVAGGEWFANVQRSAGLLEGWVAACEQAGARYVGGETPGLRGIIVPGAASFGCSAVGIVPCGHERFAGSRIRAGDRIVLLGSSGLHINGWTAMRELATRLPDGYRTIIHPADGRTIVDEPIMFGSALMQRTIIYVKFVEACQRLGPDMIRYFIPVTGHGLRKLMRAREPFRYQVQRLPRLSALFRFIMEGCGITLRDLYETYNCGVGAAAIVPPESLSSVLMAAQNTGYFAMDGGEVQPAQDGRSSVVLEPLDITYESDSLQLR